MTRVKICGLKTLDAAQCAIDAGADALGFIHFAKSPRHVSLAEAKDIGDGLGQRNPGAPHRVGVMVNPDLDTITAFASALHLDTIQLHGDESPEYCDTIRAQTGLKIWKVISVESEADLGASEKYQGHVDGFLFDAKPPEGSDLPGGNAHAFPWHIMVSKHIDTPWWLAGGLTPENVRAAIAQSGAPGVDVASGTETAPGIKSLPLIRDFITAAKGAKTRT